MNINFKMRRMLISVSRLCRNNLLDVECNLHKKLHNFKLKMHNTCLIEPWTYFRFFVKLIARIASHGNRHFL